MDIQLPAHEFREAFGDIKPQSIAIGLPGAITANELLREDAARQIDGILRCVFQKENRLVVASDDFRENAGTRHGVFCRVAKQVFHNPP